MKKRFLSWIISITFVLTSIIGIFPIQASAVEPIKDVNNIIRIEGDNRYKTTVKISQNVFPEGTKQAVIASGEKFSDALVGGNLAAHIDGPILLVRENDIPEEIGKELERLNLENIYIVGGEHSISKTVESALKDYASSVDRYYGDNRYLTSVDVADHMIEDGAVEGVAYASGQNFPDALAGSALLAHLENYTLILTDGKNIPEGAPENENKIVFGGSNSIDIAELENARRYGEKDRFLTAIDIADKGFKEYHTAILVDGTNYPDALTAVSLAKKYDAPILLTYPELITEQTLEAMKDLDKIIIVGGKNSVSEKVEEQIANSLIPENPEEPTEFELKDFVIEGSVIKGFSESGREKNKILKELTIPSKNDKGQIIDTIASSAFSEQNISKLILPESIKTIEKGAFIGNNLREIELNEGLEYIGDYAFRGAKYDSTRGNLIEKLTVPSTIKHIGFTAFANNDMKEIVIKDGVTRIDERVFGENLLEKVTLPSTLKEIEYSAFVAGKLKDIYLPDGLEVLGPKVFCRNQFRSIEIPNSLERFDPTSWRLNPGFDGNNAQFIIKLRDEIKVEDLGGMSLEDKLSEIVKVRPAIHKGNIDDEFTLLDIINWEKVSEEDGHAIYHATFTQLTQEQLMEMLENKSNGSGEESVVDHLKKMRLEVRVDITDVYDELYNTDYFTVEGNKITGLSEKGKEKVGQDGVLNIPKIEGVDTISEKAFNYISIKPIQIKEVNIDGSIKTIEDAAFGAHQTLTKLTLNKGTEIIGKQAFMAHSIETLEIPASVRIIGEQSFLPKKGEGITSLVLNEGLESIERGAFTSNKLEEVKIPNSVTNIGGIAFQKNSISFIDIGDGVKQLGDIVFKDNPIERVLIPNTIEQIHVGTFGSIGEISIEFKNGIEGINSDNINEKANLPLKIEYPINRTETALVEIISWEEKNGYFSPVFEEMLGNITLGNFDNYVFKLFDKDASAEPTEPAEEFISSIDSFIIKEGIVLGFSDKGKEEFKTIRNIEIPREDKNGNLITKVAESAFNIEYNETQKIKKIVLPDTLIEIGSMAFRNHDIEEVILPDSIEVLGEGCFANSSVEVIKFPSNENNKLTVIPKGAFSFSNVEELIIPEGITRIDSNAFTKALNLEKLILPSTLEKIESNAFNICSHLTTLRIPGNVKEIGSSAFADCGLSELQIEEGVEIINARAFRNGTLSIVKIPGSVKVLAKNTFEKNPNVFVEYQFLRDAIREAKDVENPSENLTNLIKEAEDFSAIEEVILETKTVEKANELAKKLYEEIDSINMLSAA